VAESKSNFHNDGSTQLCYFGGRKGEEGEGRGELTNEKEFSVYVF
jgi:hypothetical protein